MKKKDLEGLKTKKAVELLKMVKERKLELAKTLAAMGAGREKNLKKARNLRVEIAQILTVQKVESKVQRSEK